MKTHLPILRLCLCSPLLLLVGCGSRTTSPGADAAAATAATERGEATEVALDQAREELAAGTELVNGNRWPEARLAFDRAVDLLLGLPRGVETNPRAKALYDEALASIHELEQRNAADQDVATNEQAEEASVDDLTSEVALEGIDELASADLATNETREPAPEFDLPIDDNARVRAIIEMFQQRRHEWFQEALDRGALYLPQLRRVFEEHGLPQDLVYLAMVESAFKPRAVSRAGARGIWQFIQGTGRLYGLHQDFWVDDRFDPEKATDAAARHLKDLYEEFGDWYLAMAAYNSGSRRVQRAIRQTGSRDFWTLATKRRLPRETRSYVPLILASVLIAKEPEAYGFRTPIAKPLEFDVIELDAPLDLVTAAKSAKATLEDMKLLNPELRRWVTPLDRESYRLRIPKGSHDTIREALLSLPPEERVRFGTHVVQRGDTLSQIARRYGTTIDALVAANHIHRRSIIHPGQVVTVPVPAGSAARLARDAERAERNRRVEPRPVVRHDGQTIHVVKRGDTLGRIASAYRIPLSELQQMNGFSSRQSRIYPGQELIVHDRGGPQVSSAETVEARAPLTRSSGATYIVQTGDTLGEIAEAHGLGLSQLRRLNDMGRRQSRIHAGQELIVRESTVAEVAPLPSGGGTVQYRIRPGDTLAQIARRFGVSVDQLRAWNQLRADRIIAGETLTIHTADDSGGGPM